MVYKEFLVVSVRDEEFRNGEIAQDRVIYDLVSCEGEKVSFCLIVRGCVGQGDYQKQHQIIGPYLLPGVRISCRIAYTHRGEYFSMGMSSFAVLGKNPWEISEWIDTPGVIEFHGQAYIPLSTSSSKIKHVCEPREAEMALIWASRKPLLLKLFEALRNLVPSKHFFG